jgi:hypothetical protein
VSNDKRRLSFLSIYAHDPLQNLGTGNGLAGLGTACASCRAKNPIDRLGDRQGEQMLSLVSGGLWLRVTLIPLHLA